MNIRIEEDEHKSPQFDQKKRKLVILSAIFLVLTVACATGYFLMRREDPVAIGEKATSQKEAEKIFSLPDVKKSKMNSVPVAKIVKAKTEEKVSGAVQEEPDQSNLKDIGSKTPFSDESITKEEEVAPLPSDVSADTVQQNTDMNPEPLPIENSVVTETETENVTETETENVTETEINSSPSSVPAQIPAQATRFQAKPITVDIDALADDAMEKDAELKQLVENYRLSEIKRHFNGVTLQKYQQRDDVNLFKARVLTELQKRATKPMDTDVVLEKDEELEVCVELGLFEEMLSHYNNHTVYDLGIPADLIDELRDELIERTRANHSTLTPGSKDEDETSRYVKSDTKTEKNVTFNEDENLVWEFEQDSAPNGEEIIEDYEEYW